MNVARLNVRIEIQKNTTLTDQYGNHKNTWGPYWSCHATVSGEAPREETDSGTIVDDSKINFTVRWCSASALITSTSYRVVFNDELYDILGVDHMSFKHKAVKLMCQRVRR